MFKFGVSTFIWTEDFGLQDLWTLDKTKELGFEAVDIFISQPETFPTEATKARKDSLGLEVVTTTTLSLETNIIDPDAKVRANGVRSLKRLIDINIALDSQILGGVNYAAWGYLPGRPRTEDEWEWSVTAMREAAEYAKERSDMVIAVEPVNRFETHFLNIFEDAVRYCQDVGTGNVKVHPDTFHMIREETSFTAPIEKWGREYLGYVHVCDQPRHPGDRPGALEGVLHHPEECGLRGTSGDRVLRSQLRGAQPALCDLAGVRSLWRGTGRGRRAESAGHRGAGLSEPANMSSRGPEGRSDLGGGTGDCFVAQCALRSDMSRVVIRRRLGR